MGREGAKKTDRFLGLLAKDYCENQQEKSWLGSHKLGLPLLVEQGRTLILFISMRQTVVHQETGGAHSALVKGTGAEADSLALTPLHAP